LRVRPSSREGILCECMQVKADAIRALLSEGIHTVEAISMKTGAGTVCGGCRPRIFELTGGNAWTYVTIANIREHNEIIRSYRIQPVNGHVSPFRPGQHIVIEANIDDRWVARPYTLTSVDETLNTYEITVKREKHGYFSNWLFTHDREKIRLRVSQPQGFFLFEPSLNNPACCLMAGIGITPAVAFGRQLIVHRGNRPLYIDYSIHSREEAAFQREFADWPGQFPNISINTRVTSSEGHLGEAGIRTLLNQYSGADIYICGPKRYMTALQTTLAAIGVSPGRIHLEEFLQAGGPLTAVPRVA